MCVMKFFLQKSKNPNFAGLKHAKHVVLLCRMCVCVHVCQACYLTLETKRCSLPLHPSSFYCSLSFSSLSPRYFPVRSLPYSVLHNEAESFWALSRKSGKHVELRVE